MGFGKAIEALKLGQMVAREGWNGRGKWIMLCIPEGAYTLESNGMTSGREASIYMKTAGEMLVPWTPSQSDVLSEDWFVLIPK